MFFRESNYRAAIKARMVELKALGKKVTLKKLADQISIQYTYLSKVLAEGSTSHLSNDHLETLGELLDLSPDAIDFLLVLKEFELSQSTQRKERLNAKINHFRSSISSDVPMAQTEATAFYREANYLLDPVSFLTHIALTIPDFKNNPVKLETALGVSREKLKEALKFLSDSGFIVFDSNSKKVKDVHFKKRHFGNDHPLAKAHQQRLRSYLDARKSSSLDTVGRSFFVAFSADNESLRELRKLMDEFIEKAGKIAAKGNSEKVLSMSLDLQSVL